MKKIYLLLVLCLIGVTSFGQTVLLSGTGDGGFETGTSFALNNWTADNNSQTTRVWQIGTGQTGYTGSRGAFIGNSSTSVGSATAARTVHLYRNVTFPLGATNIKLYFKYKQATLDASYDYCKVYLNSAAPSSGAIPSTGLISSELPGSSAYSTFTLVTISVPASYAGTTQVLDFMFKCDGVSPHAYGAVDSVEITYVPTPIITVTPSSLAFGSVVTSTNSAAQTYTVSAANLSPASGNVTVTAPTNFQVSSNGTTWSSSYTVPYTSGSLSSIVGYARFAPTAATTYSGNITFAGGTATTQNIAVTGTGILMCSGTPTAGTTAATVTSGCSGYSSTLSLTGSTSGVGGITYQWQSSPTGSSWSDIAGATNSTYAATVTSGAYYHCVVTCSATSLSAASTSLQLNVSICASMPTSGTSSVTTSCTGNTIFYSSNGSSGNYATNESGVYTFYPAAAGYKLSVSFSAFSTESGYDSLNIFNGNSTAAPRLSTTSGTTLPASQTSTAADGSLTFRFTSDISVVSTGWTATIANIPGSPITSQPAPSTTVCVGAATTLTVGTLSGTLTYLWYSNTINSNTGGTSTGITTQTYAPPTTSAGTTYYYCVVTNECGVSYTTNTATVVVNSLPAVIAGNAPVCAGSTITLTSSPAGGTWSTSDGSVATVSTGGVVTGIGSGNANITYTSTTGCTRTATLTVNGSPQAINGNSGAICPTTGTLFLTDVSGAGTWTSSSASIASVGLSTGVVTGVAGGTTSITFTLTSTGCTATTIATVTPSPLPISGSLSVCPLLTTSLSDASGTGTWSGSNPSIASVSSSTGVVTGVSSGTAIVTFTLASTGCINTSVVTVNTSPAVITGALSACITATSALSDATSGGAWSSSDPSLASVDASGVVTAGSSAGTVTITYTALGCPSVATFAINGSPDADISGTTVFCTGTTTTLANAGGVGNWTSSDPSVAIAGATTGIITGATAGTATISYSNGCGTPASIVVTVNQTPTSISGSNVLCMGNTATFTDGVASGTWSSTNTSVATISSAGVVTAVTAGTTIISYTLGNGCVAVGLPVTVNALPTAITGTTTVCTGGTTTLSNGAANGTWTSSDLTIATAGASNGAVTGIAQGTATITYQNGCGSAVTTTVTVRATPAAITGSTVACLSSTTTLSNTSSGGTWTSSNSTNASVGITTGVVTGNAVGTATISYTTGCGSAATLVVTVSSSSSPITGTTTICQGSTTALSSSPAGGTWSSSNLAVGSVSTSGVVGGVNNGTVTITYSSGCGTPSTATVTVNTYASCATTYCAPTSDCSASDAITNVTFGTINNSTACANLTLYTTPVPTILQNSTVPFTMTVSNGGTEYGAVWIDYNHNGTFEASEFTSIGTGTAGFTATTNISIPATAIPGVTRMRVRDRYSTALTGTDACTVYSFGETEDYYVNISCNTQAITGTATVCVAGATTLADATSGGSWFSDNTAIATVVTTTGVVTGVSTGTAVISYLISNTGCLVTKTVTVNQPAAISGSSSVCVGSSISLTDASGAGTWSSSASAANVGASSGVVNGLSAGTSNITFTLTSSGCTIAKTITVNALPAGISGAMSACVGLTSSLSDVTGSGTWASSNTSVASVGLSTGVVTGNMAGTATITFTLGATGCSNIGAFAVNASPSAITGTLSACITATSSLSSATGGGTWSSSNTSIATINSSGVVTAGAVSGTTTISYSVAGCPTTATFAVNGSPLGITGTPVACTGATTTLSNSGGTGTWTSSDANTAIVTSAGVVTGVATGTVVISYSNGCGTPASTIVTINQSPATITGNSTVCMGSSATFGDAVAGGTWSSSNAGVAPISAAGVVNPAASGFATITYALGNGCANATKQITVNAVPGSTAGSTSVCVGATTTFTNATTGGIWSSSNPSTASVGSSSGVVTGLGEGTAVISYDNGCGTVVKAITVNAVPSAITGGGSMCAGGLVALTESATSGAWSSTVPAVATVSSSGIVTGVSTGATTISYINSCGSAATSIAVSGSITGITISPSTSGTVCQGNSASFTASGSTFATVLLSENFNSGLSAWTITNSMTAPATNAMDQWAVRGDGYYNSNNSLTFHSNDNSQFVITNADTAGSSTSVTKSILTSQAFSLAGLSSATLSFYHFYQYYSSGNDSVRVELSTDGGSTWNNILANYGNGGAAASQGTSTAFANASISLNSYIGNANCKIRFYYRSSWGFFWAVDNVSITGAGIPSYTWSGVSGATGLSCTSCTATTITPTATGANVYSVTASGGGCSTLSGVTVSVNPLPASITGTQTVCVGAATSLSCATTGGAWTISNGTIATVNSSGVVSGLLAGTAIVTYTLPTGCFKTATVTVNPIPTVNTVSNQSVCAGVNTTAVNFSGAVGGTTYSWNNDNTSVGLAASGAGNIAAFATVNSGTSLVAANITVTPSAAGCVGTPGSFTINVKPIPTVAAVSSQSLCNGVSTTAVGFSGAVTGTTYNWTNTNTSIGLASSGAGDIASFAAVNTGATMVTASVTVTPSAAGCAGTPASFTISVKPTPTVAAVSNQSICNGASTGAVNFSGAVSGATYSWANDNTSIGLASGGTGNIASFSAVNTGASTVTANITVTPSAASCVGAPTSFTISVKPTPAVASVSNQSVCGGVSTDAISFSGAVSGTTYNWTNDNTSIGLASSGVGDIASFTTVNAGTSIATANITVTPSAAGCAGAPTSFTISVKPLPTVATVSNQSVCNGAAAAAISFNGGISGTTYDWTNDNTSIGLAASGAGDIAAFSAVNTGTSLTTANITVTPSGAGCVGAPISFAINVKPTPTVAAVSDQSVCGGVSTAAVSFSGAVSGATYGWTNDNTSVGLAANGVGDIASFTTVNTGASVASANITVTPSAAGCAGTPTSFAISVKPAATVAAVSNQSVCNGASTTAINFSGGASGTTYNWTNDNTSIGLAASGTGDIASFSAINTGTSLTAANITVTPSVAGCVGAPITFTISAKPTPTVAAVSDQSVCGGGSTAAVGFSGTVSGTTYNWTNDNTSVGLAANGVDDIASFATVNAGTSVATANITVTPVASACAGIATSFAINVKPMPTVATVSDQSVCNGASIAGVSFSGAISGTVYTWTNDNTSIGLAASGTGDIATFTTVNTGTSIATANITITPSVAGCAGTPTSFTISVKPTPAIAAVSDQTICNGASTTEVDFSGSGSTYSWTNDNTAIGLAASGTGNIASFNAINTGTSVSVANITVTPSMAGCIGAAATFAISVKPAPSVAAVPDQSVCNGTATSSVSFSGVSGATYSWTNDNTSIGLAASGTGDIASFAAINIGTSVATANITVTPSLAGCVGSPVSFTVSVKPTPTVAAVADQSVCGGAATNTVSFSGSATTYSWTNDNTSIGLAASGEGDIASFAAINTGTSVATSNITVTPSASGCPGAPTTFAISVSPIPSVATVISQAVCNGDHTNAIAFDGVSGTTYSWTNDNTSIGLSATGTGDIASFSAVNTGTTVTTANITVTPSMAGCVGAPTSFTISVNPTPAVATISDQSVCNGAATAAVSLSGGVSGIVYSWTNDNTSVGLAANGIGSIASFSAINTGTSVISANVTVTPMALGCVGTPISFAISVKPTPTVATVANQSLCNGAGTTAISFSGAVSGTTYSWTNDNTLIGLAANGTGDIASFDATNTGTSVATANIAVTPSVAGCSGTPISFAINVKPTPTVASVSDQSICSGASTTTVDFSGTVSGTTYSWTNDNTSIGLAASGTGNIASFDAVNTGASVAAANITVTPSVAGCAGVATSFAINVKPIPTVAAVADQSICSGASTAAVNFDGGSGATYSWTNDNPSIGLSASGVGDIASFNAVNTGTSVATANITVTPSASGCTGASTSFAISVKPTPTVATASNQAVCNGVSTAAVSFGGSVSGTTYSWSNDNSSIGLAASGSGDIASFPAVNTGTSAVTANITVTPSASGCVGSAAMFTINVKPTPSVAAVANQSVCNGAATTTVSFTGTVAGTTYSWTNDNTFIGLAGIGAGDIASFNAVNTAATMATANITVTPSAAGCAGTTTSFTINVKPSPTVAAISNQSVCNGASTSAVSFSGSVSGTTYNWTNDNTSIGLAASGSGDITSFSAVNTGTSTATANITITPSAAGCVGTPVSFTLSVRPTPTVASVADQSLCNGAATTAVNFSGAIGGTTYSWTNDNASIGLAASGTGNIAPFNAISAGASVATANITVTPSVSGCTGVPTSFTISVKPAPSVTTVSNQSVCSDGVTAAVSFNGSVDGTTYSWTNDNASIGLAASGVGDIAAFSAVNTGTSVATANITVTPSALGCVGASTSFAISVKPTPSVAAVSNQSVCGGAPTSTVSFNGAVSGTNYSWTNDNSSIGLASNGVGNITSFSAINTGTSVATANITVTPSAAGCVGASTSFAIGVKPTPTVAGVSNQSVCNGATTAAVSFSGALSGATYSWTNDNTSIGLEASGAGDIASFSAVNTGTSAATANITITPSAAGCAGTPASFAISVKPTPTVDAVSNQSICNGVSTAAIAFGGTVSGTTYDWTNDNISIGLTASGTGNIGSFSAVNAGTSVSNANITVTPSAAGCNGAPTSFTIGVKPTPSVAAVSDQSVCNGAATATVSFGGTVTGTTYSWTNDNASIGLAASGSGDIVSFNAVNAGTSVATANLTVTPSAAGCAGSPVSFAIDVKPTPTVATISNQSMCNGASTTAVHFSGAVSGTTYSWTNSNTSIGLTANGTGDITSFTAVNTGTSVSTANIAVTPFAAGCAGTSSSFTITVNPDPLPITGSTVVCAGLTTTLSESMTGGTWSSNTIAVATVTSSGVVSGIAAGVANITYTLPTGCIAVTPVTVNPLPAAITGQPAVIVAQTTTVSSTTPGGVWISSNTSAATVASGTGIVTGVAAGTTTITYILPTGCFATQLVTVHPLPSNITGTMMICAGATTTLADTTAGGTWTSGNVAVATVVSATGVVTGISAGTAVITYMLPTSAQITAVVTVEPLPQPITGVATVCLGSTTQLNTASAGGVWASGNSSIASISVDGIVTGNATGTATITYTVGYTGCFISRDVTVNPLPATIAGTMAVCQGATTSLSNSTTGGSWSSGNSAIATVNGSGVVAGVSAGATDITYELTTGCVNIATITVNPVPAAIAGTHVICSSGAATLSDATSGGAWGSSNTGVANIGAGNGIVSGVSGGTVVITYMLPTGCYGAHALTVNPISPVTGTASLCAGSSVTMSDAISGGTWSSSDPSIATVNSATGIVSGIAFGTSAISYVMPTGCFATAVVTVSTVLAPITGNTYICVGTTSTLNHPITGGTWSVSNATVASIGSTTGIVTGLAIGTALATYTSPSGCRVTAPLQVYGQPAAISGSLNRCPGYTSALTDATPGGYWTSSDASIAAVDSNSGLVTALVSGTATISYTAGIGCVRTAVFTVNPTPGPITGATQVCVGLTTSLSNGAPGMVWSSGNTAVATISSSTGLVTAVSAGTATITYTLGSGCYTTTVVTVNAPASAITGSLGVCTGATTSLSGSTSGGTWTSSNTAVATIDVNGVVTGVTSGNSIISYTLGTGCVRTSVVTVNPVPNAITGTASACMGMTSVLNIANTGGVWSSSDASIASITPSRVVTGVAAGTATISYTFSTGCASTVVFTVNAAPMPIFGTATVCPGLTTTMHTLSTGGTWSVGNTSVASVGSATGIVTGIAAGTTNVSYIAGAGCNVYTTITVSATPAVINGATTVCPGATATLTDVTIGGTWSSSDVTLATVGASNGVVSGVAAGNVIITYTISTGCIQTKAMTVNPLPGVMSGSAQVCPATTSTLSNTASGGTWTSGATSVATIGITNGVLSGVAAGTSIITYALSTGCKMTTVATVNPLPAAISGTLSACVGSISSLSNTVPGGNWSSSNAAIASVDASGAAAGVAAGTATITYTVGTGCYKTTVFTVNPLPGAITGTTTLCIGSTSLLNSLTSGGTWVSANTAVATVGSTTRLVTAVSAGNADISYVLPTGCVASTTVTVNSLPSSITGTASVCIGNTTTLTNAMTGGAWSSGNTAAATIDAASGVVTGVSASTAMITYSITGSCIATRVVTVNALPAPITGTFTVCENGVTNLSDGTTGGTWSSSTSAVASINTSGQVSAVSAGTTTIVYTSAPGCVRSAVLTVNPVPAAITGDNVICMGSTGVIANATSGGTWSVSTPTVLGIPGSNTITGVSAGTSALTYALPTGCMATAIVTVNALPGAISGLSIICQGTMSTLTNTTSGGVWASSDATIANVDVASGIVSGISAGTVTITYTLPTGCYKTSSFTVKALPDPIVGTLTVCQGSTTQLTDPTSGGTSWSSSNTAVATINTTGIVTGVASGTATITYTLGTGCQAMTDVTVMPLPPAIGGTAQACLGLTTTLSNSVAGGTWSSANGSIASVDVSGVVSGVATGSTTITYTLPTGCVRTTAFIVNPLPPAVTGFGTACVGTSVSFTSGSGGAWSSNNTAIASVQSVSGLVTGVAPGTTTISYTFSTGCYSTKVVTVSAFPTAISGPSATCIGSTTTMTNGVSGGTWSSTYPTTASIGSATGIVTALSQGTSTITYAIGTGCRITTNITVNTVPAAITGSATMCTGSSTTLADGTFGGAWSSDNTAVATVGTSGVVIGIGAGTATISYTTGSGCSATKVVTVNALSPITGAASLCVGTSASLSNASTGGAWSSSNATVASIAASGVVTGNTAGVATISYTMSGGCYTTANITINPNPAAIGGANVVCAGNTITLTNTVTGGTWISKNVSVATIGSASGILTGIASGVAQVTYSLGSGCQSTTAITVNAAPVAITGTLTVCENATTTLSDATTGGGWSSEDVTIATVDGSGVVSGVSAGAVAITYSVPGGCQATAVVTVNAAPAAISGNASICLGNTTTLSNTVAGGAWSSSNNTVASVNSSGVVTGGAIGNAVITYAIGSCQVTTVVTVGNTSGAISGTAIVCAGNTAVLTNTVSGGVWSSSNSAVASVNAATGVVTGVSGGVVTITYTLGGGCSATTAFTVNPSTPITGSMAVCIGTTATLSNATAGGTWVSNNSVVASINSTTGVITGNSNGIATVSYTMPGGCVATAAITVSDLASTISGPSAVCAGSTATLTNAMAGGTWSSNNAAKVAVGSASGIITGVSYGSATITYTLASGCRTTTNISVNLTPNPIGGTLSVCEVGGTTNLTDASGGGVWSSNDNSLATISAGGVVSGVSAGNVVITYALANGCVQTAVVTVNPLPATISGSSQLCAGTSTALTDANPGGTWSTSNYTIANVVTATGVATGVAAGNAVITYTLPTGCKTTMAVTVSGTPPSIIGPQAVCANASITLTNGITGGTWTSGTPAIATVNSSTGVVAGAAAGTVMISYYSPAGCVVSKLVTVYPIPVPITGTMTTCPGSTTTLVDPSGPAYGWTSGNTGVASVNITYGYVTGIAAGTATITYSLGAGGCYATAIVTVNPLPSTISGVMKACPGTAAALSDADAGGTWSSSNSAIATIDPATGIATGVAAGYAYITYTLPTGCRRVGSVFTVNPLPNAITGYPIACVGTTTALSDGGGGTWSGTTSVATVGSTGYVTGTAAGTVNVTYTLNTGCIATAVVTVNPALPAITGGTVMCVGGNTTLSNAVTGGTWTSGNVAVATIGSGSGIVTGIGALTTTISYSFGVGCRTTTVITVNTPPAAITGNPSVCQGSTTSLNDVTAGGVWSSSNMGVATVGATGMVTSLTAGTTTISYTRPTGCASSIIVTVSAPADAGTISSSGGFTINSVSAPTTVTLSSSGTPGGIWTSSNTSVATVSAGGQVLGIAAGTSAISYTVSTGCGSASAVATITVTSARQGGNMDPVAGGTDVQIYPNPNKGVFTIKGTLAVAQDAEVYLEVTDVLGQVVYRNTVIARNGRIEEPVQLSNALANGMYMMTMRAAGEHKVFHFAVEQ